MKTRIISILSIALLIVIFGSCKKKKADPHVPPDVSFKTGGKYISADYTAKKQDTLLVGVIVSKTEDDLRSYNVSYAYDGASTTTTFYNYVMTAAEYEHYEKDVTIYTRNQAGKEQWVFTIVDRDGNITQKSLNITVQ